MTIEKGHVAANGVSYYWRREHMSKNRLAILPNVTHYEMFASAALVPTALSFLNDGTTAPSR